MNLLLIMPAVWLFCGVWHQSTKKANVTISPEVQSDVQLVYWLLTNYGPEKI